LKNLRIGGGRWFGARTGWWVWVMGGVEGPKTSLDQMITTMKYLGRRGKNKPKKKSRKRRK